MNASPDLVFILPANFIRKQNSTRLTKKQNRSLANNNNQSVISSLFCGIKEKVHGRYYKLPSNRHSYPADSLESGSSDQLSSSSNNTNTKRSLTPDSVTHFSDGKMNHNNNSGSSNTSKFPSSVSSPNLAKQDSGSSSNSSNRIQTTTFDLVNLSEEYGETMAERERRNEERERRMSGSRGTQTPSSGSSANGDINRTPKSKKKAMLLQPAPNREIKPSTILRLEDRDLVVIDRQDIKEAVKNESDVIIVDPPALPNTPSDNDQHVELTDILGTQWPDLAGASGALLNNDNKKTSISPSTMNGWKTVERNKSANFASHLSSSSKTRYDTYNGYRKSEFLFKFILCCDIKSERSKIISLNSR